MKEEYFWSASPFKTLLNQYQKRGDTPLPPTWFFMEEYMQKRWDYH